MTWRAKWLAGARVALVAGIAAQAGAQEPPAAPSATNADPGGNRVTIGVGPAFFPSYVGSNQISVVPGIAIEAQIAVLSFSTQGTSLSADLIPDHGTPGWKIQAGPMINVRLDRTSRIGNRQMAALGELKTAWEPGAWAGVQRTGVVTSPYDTLSASVGWSRDVAGAHDGAIVSPALSYATPLSHRDYVSLSGGADHVDRRFGRYYYDVGADGSRASGLPAYAGANRTGWKGLEHQPARRPCRARHVAARRRRVRHARLCPPARPVRTLADRRGRQRRSVVGRARRQRHVVKRAIFGLLVLIVAAAAYAGWLGYFGGPVFRLFPADDAGQRHRTAAVFLSGDMGLNTGMGPRIARDLAAHGVPVVGVNSLTTFARRRSIAETQALVRAAAERALALPGTRDLLLVGQSFGANALIQGIAGLSPAMRAHVRLVALVVPARSNLLRATPGGILDIGDDGPALPAARALDWAPVLCLHGAAEEGSLCPDWSAANVVATTLPGDHYLRHDDRAVVATVVRRLATLPKLHATPTSRQQRGG